ncbi:MAG: hypothetical protein ACYTG2_08480 [Planctomycetota bacterium]|jgi:hypothetical protein
MILRVLLLGVLLSTPAALASDLDLSVEALGSNSISVGPGDVVDWSVVGVLSDTGSQGLAMFVFDVTFDGGSLSQAATPVSVPMTAFAPPLGLSNPGGFGGTPVGGDLIQVGGAQNTMNNSFAAVPVGSVVTGTALPGSRQVLASGSLTAPTTPGTYNLVVDNVMANAIRTGETGTPFWAVDAVGVGTVTDLVIDVVALSADMPMVSLGGLESQTLSLDAGVANAFRSYFLLGSFTGSVPGINLGGGLHIPLNPDIYFTLTVDFPNTFIANSFGVLDGDGEATATFQLFPGTPPSVIGLVLSHAYILLSPKDFASNVVTVEIAP